MNKTANLILGIDDAGRGPVIGPMILAGCLIDIETDSEFKKIGVKDSKKLLPPKREALASIIREKALAFELTITHPSEITSKNAAGINLNTVEALKVAEIINKINKGFGKIKVIVDCPSPNIPAWTATLIKYIENTKNLEILCEHKADVNHIAVSAASILAKSEREREVKKIKEKIGVDFGSGYVSDPATVKFLENYFDKYEKDGIFRETWITFKQAKARSEQKKLF